MDTKQKTQLGDQSQKVTLDAEAAMRRLQGNKELYKRMVGFFLEDYLILMERLEQGIAENHAEEIRHNAHAIKGLAAEIGADRVMETAQEIEFLARDERLDKVPPAYSTLKSQISVLLTELAAFTD